MEFLNSEPGFTQICTAEKALRRRIKALIQAQYMLSITDVGCKVQIELAKRYGFLDLAIEMESELTLKTNSHEHGK